MRISKVITVLSAVTLISGCAVQKVMVPTGGSRADGTVELSYEYGLFEQPVIDMTQASQSAAQRCRAWGYSDAEAFGGRKSQCQAHDVYGNCNHWIVTTQFQCTGATPAQQVSP
jgi:YecR-like lipoprotein